MTFFGAGALLLAAGLALSRWSLAQLTSREGDVVPTVGALGLRNGTRRPGRSLATITLLACGTFLVVAIGVHHKSGAADPTSRDSGTGGFALFARSTLPIHADLDSARGRDAYGLSDGQLTGVGIVPMRVRDGDDASCLNLGAAQNPRLVGVRAELLASRAAFRFAGTWRGAAADDPWSLLADAPTDGALPAIGDAASVTWALHKKLGDTIEYLDERGEVFHVRIVGTVVDSILQGNLLIDQAAFRGALPVRGRVPHVPDGCTTRTRGRSRRRAVACHEPGGAGSEPGGGAAR